MTYVHSTCISGSGVDFSGGKEVREYSCKQDAQPVLHFVAVAVARVSRLHAMKWCRLIERK